MQIQTIDTSLTNRSSGPSLTIQPQRSCTSRFASILDTGALQHLYKNSIEEMRSCHGRHNGITQANASEATFTFTNQDPCGDRCQYPRVVLLDVEVDNSDVATLPAVSPLPMATTAPSMPFEEGWEKEGRVFTTSETASEVSSDNHQLRCSQRSSARLPMPTSKKRRRTSSLSLQLEGVGSMLADALSCDLFPSPRSHPDPAVEGGLGWNTAPAHAPAHNNRAAAKGAGLRKRAAKRKQPSQHEHAAFILAEMHHSS